MKILGWPSLPGLLGMSVVNGTPLDPVLEDSWKGAVEATIEERHDDGERQVSVTAAYQIAFHFLDRQLQRGYDCPDDVINGFYRKISPDWESQLEDDSTHALHDFT